jgi:cysteine desulfurase
MAPEQVGENFLAPAVQTCFTFGGVSSMKRIYLDHTATTPLDPRVREAMEPYLTETFGNPSSAHWYGRQAKSALEDARACIARVINARPGEVFFTSGGTESDNLAIRGSFRAAVKKGKRRIVTQAAEHHAVLDTCEAMLHEGAGAVTVLPVDEHAGVDLAACEQALLPDTALISIMFANNEVGTILPLRDIALLARARGIPVHTDAVQAVGRIPVDVEDLGVDLLTFTAHKIYGPKGIGALYVRRGTALEPLMQGGGQERGKRPGTENVALAVGFARAVELAAAERQADADRLLRMRDTLEQDLRREFPAVHFNGHPVERLPHILSISFDHSVLPMEGEMLLTGMDVQGIALSSGSACTSGSVQPSHVLLAMGRDPGTARATLRFSFGKLNTPEEIPVVLSALREVVGRTTSGS